MVKQIMDADEISVVRLKVAASQTFNALLSVLDSSQFIN
jgi:hypothetical protein